jgi:hypothetical protein
VAVLDYLAKVHLGLLQILNQIFQTVLSGAEVDQAAPKEMTAVLVIIKLALQIQKVKAVFTGAVVAEEVVMNMLAVVMEL